MSQLLIVANNNCEGVWVCVYVCMYVYIFIVLHYGRGKGVWAWHKLLSIMGVAQKSLLCATEYYQNIITMFFHNTFFSMNAKMILKMKLKM